MPAKKQRWQCSQHKSENRTLRMFRRCAVSLSLYSPCTHLRATVRVIFAQALCFANFCVPRSPILSRAKHPRARNAHVTLPPNNSTSTTQTTPQVTYPYLGRSTSRSPNQPAPALVSTGIPRRPMIRSDPSSGGRDQCSGAVSTPGYPAAAPGPPPRTRASRQGFQRGPRGEHGIISTIGSFCLSGIHTSPVWLFRPSRGHGVSVAFPPTTVAVSLAHSWQRHASCT